MAEPVVVLHDGLAGAGATLAAKQREAKAARKGKGGRPARPAVELVMAGPPPYGSPEEWGEDVVRLWAQHSVEWARELLGPESVVALAVLHRDETSPHVHVLAVPVDSGGVLGWERVKNEAGARMGGSGRKAKRGVRYSQMQDHYHARVGEPFTLRRGEKGSKAKHNTINRQRASERAIEANDAAAIATIDTAANIKAARTVEAVANKAARDVEATKATARKWRRDVAAKHAKEIEALRKKLAEAEAKADSADR